MMTNFEITKPAKHGFVIDLHDGERRVQVRVFEFEPQQVPGMEGRCEMPVTIDEGHALVRLRQGMEAMRERMMDDKVTGGQGDKVASGHPVIVSPGHLVTEEGGVA